MQILTKIVTLAIIICFLWSISAENSTTTANDHATLNKSENSKENASKPENKTNQSNGNVSEISVSCGVSGKNLTTAVDEYANFLNESKNWKSNISKLEKEIERLNDSISKIKQNIYNISEQNIYNIIYNISDIYNISEEINKHINENISFTNKTINELNLTTNKLNVLKDNSILTTAIGVIPSLIIGLSIATLIGFVLLVNRWKR